MSLGKTKIVWCETPTNPLLGIADIEALSAVTGSAGVHLVVDNTLASPFLQKPLSLGADVVVHSTTKYLAGHSDLLGGAVLTQDDSLTDEMRVRQNSTGAVPSPFDCWLTLRGIKTLAVRMRQQCETAQAVAEFLAAHDGVARVFYPGLPEHPNHDVAAKQMNGFGGIVSFELPGGEEAAINVCNAARVFTLGESLGAVESLISHPLRMTHIGSAGSAVAPPGDVVRLSIGLESRRDLIRDLTRALASAANGT
jgi:cystathionine gamma-synthase